MTDPIFANVRQVNCDADPSMLRISMDTKATVNLGEYSRGGKSRGPKAVRALDHDMANKQKLIPGGILEPVSGQSFLFFGDSHKTSDFMVDGLEAWWEQRKGMLSSISTLVINSDNGPECSGHRTQYLQRMVRFADNTGLIIRLVYYPPYHSKYNAIERCWAGLEKSWNGYLLDSKETALKRAGNFIWKGKRAMVTMMAGAYEKGVKLAIDQIRELEARLQRSALLKWWDIAILPETGILK
jgi:Rhodopirellula transposase DDE domain